jgi:hypothetical protein
MAKPYITAFKDTATCASGYIEEEQIIYWYRPTLRGTNCDATDTTMLPDANATGAYYQGRPYGWQYMEDLVYVATLLKSSATLTINSGCNTITIDVSKGATLSSLAMAVGQQSFALSRNGEIFISGVSLRDISEDCPCGKRVHLWPLDMRAHSSPEGLYNFNAYVGILPTADSLVGDRLGPDGLGLLTTGLRVSTCRPTPTLGTVAPPYTGTPTSTTTSVYATTTSTPTSSCTITASSQLFPTNCLQPGCVWKGQSGSDSPDYCNGQRRRRY